MTQCNSLATAAISARQTKLGLILGAMIVAFVAVHPAAASEIPSSRMPGAGGWADGPVSWLPQVDALQFDVAQPGPLATPSLLPMFKSPAVMLTAYQDEPPKPPGQLNSSQTGSSQGGNGQAGQTGPDGQQQPLGQRPVDNSEVFLRSETVLLDPGEWELDWGFEYIWQEARGFTLLPGDILALERIRLRQLFMPMAFRWGMTERLQPFINFPWGGAQFERANPLDATTDTDFGIGDISAGFSYLLCQNEEKGTDWIFNFGFTAPTGTSPFGDFNAINNFASLGSGFWAISANLNWVRSIDPCVLFGGFGWAHEFDAEEFGFDLNPGEIVTYQFGMGFAVNDNITLSTMFQGQWQERFQVDDVTIADSSQEPFTIRMAMTIVYSRRCIIEPFVRFGLNEDAPEADFGVIITRRSCP